uniref:Uncharacterized protein n=1 Tax=viral metagenome TaxID=1070528 RepID=A0A6M3LYL2_9ZZZZ
MKPIRPLSELRAFRNVIDKYTGRRLLTAPLRPIYRAIPSPAAALLRILAL